MRFRWVQQLCLCLCLFGGCVLVGEEAPSLSPSATPIFYSSSCGCSRCSSLRRWLCDGPDQTPTIIFGCVYFLGAPGSLAKQQTHRCRQRHRQMDGRVGPQQYGVGGSGSGGRGGGGRNQHQFHSETAQQQAIAAVSARGWGARSQQQQQQQQQPGWGAVRHGGMSAAAGSRSSSVSDGISVPSIVQFAAPAFTAPPSVSGIAATSAAAAATTAGRGAGLPNAAGGAPLGGGSRGPVEGADVIEVRVIL